MNEYDTLLQHREALARELLRQEAAGQRPDKRTVWALSTLQDSINKHPDHAAREAERRQARQLADYLKGER